MSSSIIFVGMMNTLPSPSWRDETRTVKVVLDLESECVCVFARNQKTSSLNVKQGVRFDWRRKDINYQVRSAFSHFSYAFHECWNKSQQKTDERFPFLSTPTTIAIVSTETNVNWLNPTSKLVWNLIRDILRLHLSGAQRLNLFMAELIPG